VLIGQPPLRQLLALSINEEIRPRVTYSVVLPRLSPEAIEAFVPGQLDRAGLGHNTRTAEALALIVRCGEGLLRRTRNLCLGSLIETVRDQTRVVNLQQVKRVLIQPHWRKDCDHPLVYIFRGRGAPLDPRPSPRRPLGPIGAAPPTARSVPAGTRRRQLRVDHSSGTAPQRQLDLKQA
jgi:hypothetical protein